MKITESVDELLVRFPNLIQAVSILIQGISEKRYGALSDWDEFRKKDAAQNTIESTAHLTTAAGQQAGGVDEKCSGLRPCGRRCAAIGKRKGIECQI